MRIEDILKEEEQGQIFCKIGKSMPDVQGKGGYFPYEEHKGKIIQFDKGTITFERIDDVSKFLHYGDVLVVFCFAEEKQRLPKEYFENELNKGCYEAEKLYVQDVLPFSDVTTVDYIYSHMKDKINFIENSRIAINQLNERELYGAAQRWEELAYTEVVQGEDDNRQEVTGYNNNRLLGFLRRVFR